MGNKKINKMNKINQLKIKNQKLNWREFKKKKKKYFSY